MDYILESNHTEDYLKDSRYVDFGADSIQKEAGRLFDGCNDECTKIKAAFEFARDNIAHSWDIQSKRITKTASEVLQYREGICYAKSMLLAALLRIAGIPTGFCYQRLTLGDTPDTGYCVHALNAVRISTINRWVRIDARGNTNGRNAQFYPEEPQREQLAFPVRPEYDEIDYPTIYAEPLPITTKALESNTDCLKMIQYHLPKSL
jgi:transglutaminase-like putative cysteine protease